MTLPASGPAALRSAGNRPLESRIAPLKVRIQLEARRRPALAAALARLDSVAGAFTTDEHAALGLSVSPEAVPTLMALYGGALFALVTGPGDVQPDTVRQIVQAIVHGALDPPTPGAP